MHRKLCKILFSSGRDLVKRLLLLLSLTFLGWQIESLGSSLLLLLLLFLSRFVLLPHFFVQCKIPLSNYNGVEMGRKEAKIPFSHRKRRKGKIIIISFANFIAQFISKGALTVFTDGNAIDMGMGPMDKKMYGLV